MEFVTKYAHAPADIRHYNTEQLRTEFLIEHIFVPGEICLTYTHNDRQIFWWRDAFNRTTCYQFVYRIRRFIFFGTS